MLTGERLRDLAGKGKWEEGADIARSGRILRSRLGKEAAVYMLLDPPHHTVTLSPPDVHTCSCGARYCSHLVAAFLKAAEDGAMNALLRRQEQMSASALFDAVEGALPEGASLVLEPSVFLREGEMRVSLRVGEQRLYVVGHLPRFLRAVRNGERAEPAKGFSYDPGWMRFDEKQGRVVSILSEYCESLERAGCRFTAAEARRMLLPPATARRFLDALSDLSFRLTVHGRTRLQRGIQEEDLPAMWTVEDGQGALKLSARLSQDCFLVSPDGSYLFSEGRLGRVVRGKRTLARTVVAYRMGETAEFVFRRKEIPRVIAELLPSLMRAGAVLIDPALERRMIRLPLSARVYLDRAGGDVVARAVFTYGEHGIDPFSVGEDPSPFLLRDVKGEGRVLELLSSAGFRVRRRQAYLSGDEEVYRFMTEGLESLNKVAEVFLSQEFGRFSPRKPALRGRLLRTGSRLRLEVYDGETPVEDLLPLMQALSEGSRYFRYRDGSYVNLEGLESWSSLAESVCEAIRSGNGEQDLGLVRAAYLQALIRDRELPVSSAGSLTDPLHPGKEVPVSPVASLRPWQQKGFRWLCSLFTMRMGGILADEMGLGKTVQMIAALSFVSREKACVGPSLVVAPTSLLYNWMAEIERFAPKLKAQLIAGNREARHRQFRVLRRDEGAADVLVTSYALLRQDITLFENLSLRFVVLDEAQYVKNPDSIGAAAVKRLKAHSRIALTGTPMENNIGELWSLFDIVLPGYLPPLKDFIRRYDEGRNAEDLLMRIRPFMMRRLKRDVISELPDKLETTITAGMSPEQRRVYDASLLRSRDRVKTLLADRGLAASRGEVLAAITQLRQICGHPALCLSQFAGKSGKLEMLMDLLSSALMEGHRVLLFSQFTGMLRIIRQRLVDEGIESLYLDGETPTAERLPLTERFNKGKTPVFLVSLKAGGTGLNLTGADMVIHYDPWWNPAAEDQAVDRAHRIGQKKEVQVIRLVTRHSIEERVASMSMGKRKLFDRLITPGETMPSRLSAKQILALFGEETAQAQPGS